MRAEKLQELVYKGGNSGVTKASVTVKFDNSNKSQSPPGYTEVESIVVTRTIENSKSKYYVNGRSETADKVKSLFCSVKLNINNPHFLIMQGRVTKVINMKPREVLGLIEEAAGISLYQRKKDDTLNLIKKKDNKLIEIDKILSEEVNPQLEKLRKEKNDYALYVTNERMIEENEKVTVAYEYHENARRLQGSDSQVSELAAQLARLEQELRGKEADSEAVRRQIQVIQKGGAQDDQREKDVTQEIHRVEKALHEATVSKDQFLRDQQRFKQLKLEKLVEVDRAESEAERVSRQVEDLVRDSIPQAEKDLEDKKEQRRNVDHELRQLREGKDNSAAQMATIKHEIDVAINKQQAIQGKQGQIEAEMRLKQKQQVEIERDMANFESH
jgi:structural maintenance of chromosome 2